ncbi:MAG TPA: hypothetical protein VFX60_19195 [Micromonospora sp.]|nr:hypothetical protein [Micromonospora sp.]
MNSSLQPTLPRVVLLSDVSNGLIVAEPSSETIWRDERLSGFYDPFTATRTKITARARELEQAGWIKPGPNNTYQLTDEGKAILAARTGRPAQEG